MRALWLLSAGTVLVLSGCGGSSGSALTRAEAPTSSSAAAPSPAGVLAGAPTRTPGTARPLRTPAPKAAAVKVSSSPAAARTTVRSSPTPKPAAQPTVTAAPASTPKPRTTPPPTPSPKPAPRPSPTTAAGTTHALDMVAGDRFSPSTLTIAVGDSVRAHNADSTTHTFTGPSWDSGDMGPAAVKTFRFTTAGTFDFYCTPHKSLGMTGTLTVR